MNQAMLLKLFSISLKGRILRAWQKASCATEAEYTEADMLLLEVIAEYGPVTEKSLGKILGMAPSSVSDHIDKLGGLGLLAAREEGRGKPLGLSDKGKSTLSEIKRVSASRYGYLFAGLDPAQTKALITIFTAVEKNAEDAIQKLVFQKTV
jgi:DNA-binding MarR family transcriptional regulator